MKIRLLEDANYHKKGEIIEVMDYCIKIIDSKDTNIFPIGEYYIELVPNMTKGYIILKKYCEEINDE